MLRKIRMQHKNKPVVAHFTVVYATTDNFLSLLLFAISPPKSPTTDQPGANFSKRGGRTLSITIVQKRICMYILFATEVVRRNATRFLLWISAILLQLFQMESSERSIL
jgi:hypothetical protein